MRWSELASGCLRQTQEEPHGSNNHALHSTVIRSQGQGSVGRLLRQRRIAE